jgi:acyl carrier protein
MSSQPVPQSLRDIFADTLEIAPEDVTPELSVDTAENWDSFSHLQLILAVEGEYGVQFDPAAVATLTTVAKVQEALQQKGAQL